MISVSALVEGLNGGDWVVFESNGSVFDVPVAKDFGPANLLVESETDALKLVADGLIAGSLDRARVWRVVGMALNRVVVNRIPDGVFTPIELYDVVRGFGLAWRYLEPAQTEGDGRWL
jgi:hypothetical protein